MTKEFIDEQLEWNKIFLNCVKTTLDLKIKNFQYKYLHRKYQQINFYSNKIFLHQIYAISVI